VGRTEKHPFHQGILNKQKIAFTQIDVLRILSRALSTEKAGWKIACKIMGTSHALGVFDWRFPT